MENSNNSKFQNSFLWWLLFAIAMCGFLTFFIHLFTEIFGHSPRGERFYDGRFFYNGPGWWEMDWVWMLTTASCFLLQAVVGFILNKISNRKM